MKKTFITIATALLVITSLLNSSVSAEELPIRKMVRADKTLPFEIKAVAINEFDRHISKMDTLYKELVSPSVFTLSNNSTYMLFEITDLTGDAHLRMFVQISDETGQVELLWAKETGLHWQNARR